jgi:plasmid stabilization system protein ParE
LKLRYTPDALADLRKVLAYIEKQSPQGAPKVQARIQQIIKLTLNHPRAGGKRLRRLVARPYPYLIFTK